MAKAPDNGQYKVDVDDMFDSSFDLPDFSFDPPPPKNKREAILKVGKEVKQTAWNTVKSPSFFRALVKTALPKGYGQAIDLADTSATTMRDLTQGAVSEVKPALQDLARFSEKLMPSAEKYTPKKAQELLRQFQAKFNPKSIGTGLSVDPTSMAIADLLGSTFKYTAETDAKNRMQDQVTGQLRETIAQDRHRDQLAQLDAIRQSVAKQSAYQKIDFNYKRKSLELQARHYYVAANTLEEMKRFNSTAKLHMEGILHNTALPDYVKMTLSDKVKQLAGNKFLDGAGKLLKDSLFDTRSAFIKNIGTAIREQAKASLKAVASGVQMGVMGAEMSADTSSDFGMDKYTMAGQAGGKMLASVGRRIGQRFIKKGVEGGSGTASTIRKLGNRLQYGVENAPQHLTDFANSKTSAYDYVNRFNTSALGGKLPEGLKQALLNRAGLLDPALNFGRQTLQRAGQRDNKVREGNMSGLTEVAVWNKQSNKTLNEIIPGLLARQLRELQIIRTGDENTELISYNFDKGGFDTHSGVKKTAFNKLFTQQTFDRTRKEGDDVFNTIDPKGTALTPEQRKILGNRFLADNTDTSNGRVGKAGSFDRYSKKSTYTSPEEAEHAEAFAAFFKELQKNDKEGARQTNFAGKFSDLGKGMGDKRADVQAYIDAHQREILEDMGIMTPGSPEINMAALSAYAGGKQYNPSRATGMPGVNPMRPAPVHAPVPSVIPVAAPHVETGLGGHQMRDDTAMKKGFETLVDILEKQNIKPLTEQIKELLEHIKERLDDGIVTQAYMDGMVPGGAKKKGLFSRLNVRISDLASGALKAGRWGIGKAAGLGNGLVSSGLGAVSSIGGFALGKIGGVASNAIRRAKGFKDVYVGDEKKPRMYGRKMEQRGYLNAKTNKPILKFSDITEDGVNDTNGNNVMDGDEVKDAYVREGAIKKSLRSLGAIVKLGGRIGNGIINIALGGIPPLLRGGIAAARKLYSFTDMPVDIFVKGNLENPALRATIMRNGGYYSAGSGKVIMKPSQIDGPVLTGQGEFTEIALSNDDIKKGLVDSRGRPIKTGWRKIASLVFGGAKKVLGLAKSAGDLAWKAGSSVVRTGLRGLKTVAGAAIDVGGAGFDALRGVKNRFTQGRSASSKQTKEVIAIGSKTNDLLTQIRDTLNSRLPERKKHVIGSSHDDGVRDGSYEDLMAHKKKEDAAAAAAPAGKAGSAGKIFGGAAAGIKSLWNKIRGKKQKYDEDGNPVDDDSGGGLLNDLPGGGSGAGKVAGEVEKDVAKAVPKGFLGKAGHYGMKGLKGLGSVAKWGAGALVGDGAVAATLGAGSMLASGAVAAGGALLTGAAAVATGLGAIIASPVFLGAAALALVGAGAYYGYKALTKQRLGTLSRVRYVQYGFSPADSDHSSAVFELEGALQPALKFGKDGATLDDKKVDQAKLLSIFSVDKDDAVAMQSWTAWFAQRFKPVFLTHATALNRLMPDKTLADVDGLDVPIQKQYLQAVKFPDGPYSTMYSPFKDLPALPSGSDEVKAIIKVAEAEIAKNDKGDKSKDGKGTTGLTEAAAVGVGAAVATAEINKPGQADGAKPPGLDAAVLTSVAAQNVNTSDASSKRGITTVVGSSVVLNSLGANRLDGLSAIRYKTYGLVKMEADKVKQLNALETAVAADIVYNKGIAGWTGSLEQVVKGPAAAFGVDSSDEDRSKAWLLWFNQRFLPVFLNYATALRAQTGKEDLSAARDLLKPTSLVDVATVVMTSTNKANGGGSSVWNVTASPWDGYDMNTDIKSTDANIQGLKELAKNTILPENTSKVSNQPSSSKGANSGNESSAGKSTGVLSGIKDSISSFFGGGSKTPVTAPGGAPATAAGGGGGGAVSGGRQIDQPGKGTGGDINAIPIPKGNKSWDALKDTILAAAKMVGVDPKLMAAMAAIESNFDYNARAGTSSASGLYQFIDGTWKHMLKKYGAKYGIDPNTAQTDPRANALMGAEYIKENMAALQGSVNRPLTDTDLYFAHFLGSGGAKKFLNAAPDAIGASILPDAARANQGIFYDKKSGPLTVAQIYDLVSNRVKNRGANLGINDGGESLATSPTSGGGGGGAAPVPGADKPAGKDDKSASAGGGATGSQSAPPITQQGIDNPSLAPSSGAPDGKGKPTAKAGAGSATASAGGVSATASVIPIGNAYAGFTPSATKSLNDVSAQNQRQNDVKSMDLGATNQILSDSFEVQKKQLSFLEKILDSVQKNSGGATPKDDGGANTQPGNGAAREAPKPRKQMPQSPISLARPPDPY